MCDLQGVNAEYRHGSVDAEALQAGQHGVGPDEEGDHVSEGGDGDGHPGVLHRLAKPVNFTLSRMLMGKSQLQNEPLSEFCGHRGGLEGVEGLGDHEDVVNADAEEDEGDDGVGGGVEQPAQ